MEINEKFEPLLTQKNEFSSELGKYFQCFRIGSRRENQNFRKLENIDESKILEKLFQN